MRPIMRAAPRLLACLAFAALLAGCGGINRAVTAFPTALDDLAAKRDPERAPDPAPARGRAAP